MNEETKNNPPISDRSGVTDAVRVQILATEHWSLLATRSMIWNEIFSRASMFVTLLSAAVVGLALVAQATGFGPGFLLFALLILPVVLLMGVATAIRLGDANVDDFGLVMSMNRLRHAYMELAPELEPYFTTSHHDDPASIIRSYGLGYRMNIARILGGTPSLVAAINVVVFGVITFLIAGGLGASITASVIARVAAALAGALAHGAMVSHAIRSSRSGIHPRFPGGEAG